MSILAIDPGTEHSGVVLYDPIAARVVHAERSLSNWALLSILRSRLTEGVDALAIEWVQSYGMPVGREIFETVAWVGRFEEAWHASVGIAAHRVTRGEVKIHVCGTNKARDANVRQALLDRIGPHGTKKDPGPTYGVKTHAWSALGVAVTMIETRIVNGRSVHGR